MAHAHFVVKTAHVNVVKLSVTDNLLWFKIWLVVSCFIELLP